MNLSSSQWEKLSQQESPFFVYDVDWLAAHAENLQANADMATLWYAVKANPLSALLKQFAQAGFGFDIASLGELRHVQRHIKSPRLLGTGPAKSRQFLAALIAADATIVFESVEQLRLTQELATKTNQTVKGLLRLQLDWSDAAASVLGGHTVTAFGMGPTDWEAVNPQDFPAISLLGFHVFQWGNIGSNAEILKIWERIIRECRDFAAKMDIKEPVVDLGGGLGVDYDGQTTDLDWPALMRALRELKGGLGAIWLELGRFAVGPAGSYFAQVVDRKVVRGKDLLVLNGGMNHLIRPALAGQNFPARVLGRSGELHEYQVHGPLCTALDTLPPLKLPADTAIGDWIEFSNTGAYGFTESMPFFLCHDLAAEYIVANGEMKTLRGPAAAASWLR